MSRIEQASEISDFNFDNRVRVSCITGSRGQDGSYLRESLGFDKTVGCPNPHSLKSPDLGMNEFRVDLSNKTHAIAFLKKIKPKSIFHLAAKHGPSGKMIYSKSENELMYKTHVKQTRVLAESIVELGLGCNLIVAGSSRIFAGIKETTFINEGSEPCPVDWYGETKAQCWEILKSFRLTQKLKCSFLILFNHESPRRNDGYLFSHLSKEIRSYLDGNSSEIRVNNAEWMGNWCDARDVVQLMIKVADSDLNEDFVVAGSEVFAIKDLVMMAMVKLQVPASQNLIQSLNSDLNQNMLFADNQKSVKAQLWSPDREIVDTLVEMVSLQK